MERYLLEDGLGYHQNDFGHNEEFNFKVTKTTSDLSRNIKLTKKITMYRLISLSW
ncbi:hypothetical protein SAMN04488097_3601 [Epilithonimonas lactis]|nr:hypothetical protein SAMN04488097_3601 [Epilithonimonas lactis]